MFDNLTLGLLKKSIGGGGALCAKTYVCFGDYNKISTKGLNKRLSELYPAKLKEVLETEQSGSDGNMDPCWHHTSMVLNQD